MRSIWCFGGLLVTALVLPGCQPASEAPGEKAVATPAMSDEDMLDAQLEEFEKAWDAGDAKALSALYVNDGDLVDPSGTLFDGRDAIEKRYQDLLGNAWKGTKIAITMTSTRFPAPDVAIANGTYEITGMKTAEGADVPAMKGLYTNIVVKQGGEWRIHSSRPMVPLPVPPPSAGR